MKKITDEEINHAFKMWHLHYSGKVHETTLTPYLSDQIKPYVPHQTGWLRKTREGLFLSTEGVAQKLKVSRAAYSKYEEHEEKGSITLATLAKAAESMDCELVYALRPKNKKHFSQIIFAKLLPQSLLDPWIRNCDQRRRSVGLVAVLKRFMNDSKFRKEQGWSQRAPR